MFYFWIRNSSKRLLIELPTIVSQHHAENLMSHHYISPSTTEIYKSDSIGYATDFVLCFMCTSQSVSVIDDNVKSWCANIFCERSY